MATVLLCVCVDHCLPAVEYFQSEWLSNFCLGKVFGVGGRSLCAGDLHRVLCSSG